MALTVPNTVKFNGQDVVVSKDYMTNLNDSASTYNKATGKALTPEQYDRQLNPQTAGARWGDVDPLGGGSAPAATPSTVTPSSNGGGLLNPNPSPAYSAPTPQATAQQAVATTYDPTKQVVSDKSTVQNQLADITSNGSALNTLAAADANKESNRRGLLNSSIAVGAAQKAVLQSALPIAQQDASTNASADAANATFANSASQFNAGAKNTTSQTNAQLGTQVSLANSTTELQKQLAQIQSDTTLSAADKQIKSQQIIAQMNNVSAQTIARNDNNVKLQLQQIDAETKKTLATLDSDSKTKLSQLEADNRQLLQTNISAANEYAQYVQALSGIQTNKDMDGIAKQAAADSQLAALQASLKAIGSVSGLDLSKYFQSAAVIPQTPATPPNVEIPTSPFTSDGGG